MDKVSKEEVLHNVMSQSKGRRVISAENVNPLKIAELTREMVSDGGIIHPVPYERIKDFTLDEINLFLMQTALYTFPTTELVEWLRSEIDDGGEFAPDAIEICCGSGWLGRELDIPITDSRLQEREDIMKIYREMGQPVIQYPDDVEKLDAVSAVKKYQPEFVIGSYVTNKWGNGTSRKVGNIYGVDNGWIAAHCHKYFMIGNENVHGRDIVMKRKHQELAFDWLVTRGDSSKARIYVFENKQWTP